MKITLSKNNFNPNPYYTLPIDLDESIDLKSTIDTFDQNGFEVHLAFVIMGRDDLPPFEIEFFLSRTR